MKQVLIIGAGPPGMAAALTAAEGGASVTLLERRPKPGKKLLATGNGRCNLANRGKPVYFGDEGFALRVLSICPVDAVTAQLERWGLPLWTDPEGRVYPATQQAASVLSVLSARLRNAGVQLITDADAASVTRTSGGFQAAMKDGRRYEAERLILATGGLAGGALGNQQEDYDLAAGLGHSVTDLYAGLAPLEIELGRFKKLSGLRIPANVSLLADRRPIAAAGGELLFTDYGVSGICVMQLARDAQAILRRGGQPRLQIDLSPIWFPAGRTYARLTLPVPDARAQTLALLKERLRLYGRDGLLTGLIPEALIPFCPRGSLEDLAAFLTAMPLKVTGVRPMRYAQITCGGIDTEAVDPETMMSRRCPDLYLAGELLNVDGDCGGFNLQFAFATGIIAGGNSSK